MIPKNSDWMSAQEVTQVRKRVLKACLAVAIMAQLSERSVLSATNIIAILQRNFNVKLSAGTVYPILDKLEKDGKIRRVPRRIKRLYVLTPKGKENIVNMQEKIEPIRGMVTELISGKNNNNQATEN